MIKEGLREWIDVCFKSILIILVLYIFFWPFKIDGSSMEINFFNNDRIAVSRIMKYIDNINYSDCVVCQIENRGENEKIIKRVIGKPFDIIKIKDGIVYRNGDVIDEPYISTPTTGNIEVVLAKDEYFVMGDNRAISLDSRSIGPINRKKIVGKVIVKWYPFRDFKVY